MNRILSTLAIAAVAAFTFVMPASADTVAATGSFTGASDHITTGGVSVIKTSDGGAVVILDSNFSLDGAPDPKVGFGIDGKYVAASDLGELTNKDGLQAYVVPASVKVDDFNEVYIWCEQFAVPLGVAALN
jgi:hypothetical protein